MDVLSAMSECDLMEDLIHIMQPLIDIYPSFQRLQQYHDLVLQMKNNRLTIARADTGASLSRREGLTDISPVSNRGEGARPRKQEGIGRQLYEPSTFPQGAHIVNTTTAVHSVHATSPTRQTVVEYQGHSPVNDPGYGRTSLLVGNNYNNNNSPVSVSDGRTGLSPQNRNSDVVSAMKRDLDALLEENMFLWSLEE